MNSVRVTCTKIDTSTFLVHISRTLKLSYYHDFLRYLPNVFYAIHNFHFLARTLFIEFDETL